MFGSSHTHLVSPIYVPHMVSVDPYNDASFNCNCCKILSREKALVNYLYEDTPELRTPL